MASEVHDYDLIALVAQSANEVQVDLVILVQRGDNHKACQLADLIVEKDLYKELYFVELRFLHVAMHNILVLISESSLGKRMQKILFDLHNYNAIQLKDKK